MKSINVKPTAKVAIKRNVLKQYNVKGQETVFMANGTEFELELFNPSTETIMCKISYNGKTEDDGIVLYPGQRVFLERYLSNDAKLKFTTYEVDSKDQEALNAIALNGDIKVEFFKEYTYSRTWEGPNFLLTNYGGTYTAPLYGSTVTTSASCFYSSADLGSTSCANRGLSTPTALETGRIDKGSQSNQEFRNVQNDFQYYPFEIVKIKILPDSQKLLDADDLKYKKYCSECGKKVNHNDKFCSYCGSKL